MYAYRVTVAAGDGSTSNTFVYEQPGTTSLPVSALQTLYCQPGRLRAVKEASVNANLHKILDVQTTLELPRGMFACGQNNSVTIAAINCATSPNVTATIVGPPCGECVAFGNPIRNLCRMCSCDKYCIFGFNTPPS